MNVDRRALFAALKLLLPVTDPKASLAALGHVLLEAAEGRIKITATNLGTTLVHTMPTTGDLTTCLSAKMLAALVRPEGRGDAGEVTLEESGGFCSIVVEGLTSKLVSLDPEDFPTAGEKEWRLLAFSPSAPLAEALSFVLPAASSDEGRPHLCCILLDSGKVVTTDGHRLHMAPVSSQIPEPLLLPLDAAKTLVKLLGEGPQVVIAKAGEQVRFGVGPWQLTTKIVDARFPPYEKVIPAKDAMTTNLTVDQALLSRALARVSRLSKDSPVRLRINGAITIETERPDRGEAEVVVPVLENDHTGEDLVVGVAPAYLRDAVCQKGEPISASFTGPTDAIRLDLPGDKLAIVMPMRL